MDAFIALAGHHPLIALHLAAALLALVAGGLVMARRKGTPLHRVLGWSFVGTLGLAALSSAFIRDTHLPNIAGFTPIHVFTVLVLVGLPRAIWQIRRGNVVGHRRTMQGLFIGGCVVAGVFTLLPGRFLGDLLWHQALGLV
jgi:uncharacterized membrane protein